MKWIGNLPEKEFRVVIVKMIKEFRRRMNAQSKKLGVFNRVRNYKEQPEMKNTITEMKNALGGINSRLNDTDEQQISKLEDKIVEIIEPEQKKEEECKEMRIV